MINPNIVEFIINGVIVNLNKYLNTDFIEISSELNLLSILAYLIFCILIAYVLFVTFKARNTESIKQSFILTSEKNKENKQIQFPKTDYIESPLFRKRLKKYFELKYQKFNLILKNADKEGILYGSYQDGYRVFYLFIAYDDSLNNQIITVEQIKKKKLELESFAKHIISKNEYDNILIDYYYVSADNEFQNYQEINYFIKTEDKLLNELIDFNGYLNKIINGYQNEKLFSAIALDKDKKTLSETFISPPFNVNENESKHTGLVNYINKWLKTSSESKHLVLLGDYGMGKTSFLRHYSGVLAKNITTKSNKLVRFPVMISLTNSSPRHGGITEKIKAFVAENLGVDYTLFEILIHKGKILFLLDGFDEMGFVGTHNDRFKQINEIWQLAHKKNKLIISGRPSYFPSNYELIKTFNIVKKNEQITQTNPFCESIQLNLLNESHIKEYISKYYPNKVEEYFDWIIRFPSIFELCKRPSMMHIIREMLPNLYRKGATDIQSHGGAIEQYIDYWINRQESKNIQSAFDNHLKKREFVKSFFSELAVELFLVKQYELSSDYVIKKLNEHIHQAGIKEFKADYQKEGFENEMLTCYFIEIEDGYYRFVHKSFFEHFVAQKIIQDISSNKFKSKILYEEWSNSIVNFIYDEIPNELKESQLIPALLSLTNKQWISKLKSKIFKFVLKNSEKILALLVLFTTS
ncbi:NACHT domain-containing protein, partial [Winogradskyella sp. 4-2091]|uniref:NACHT domain-containing protein n=1 Tax=Winogradskyella sp. 4-2091 TaxID=3381659 RepID=UPI00389168AC